MSKKVTQPKEAPKPLLDEDNEPFLRTLQKKIRNINKKLTQITELEAKDNLKPEQVEKVARKAALLEERTRIEETATLFKENYAENIAVYRAAQLKELETLSRAIILYHAGAKLPENAKLASLWSALQQQPSGETFNQAINALSNALKTFADDRRLQKSLSSYVEEHGNKKIEAPSVHEEAVEAVKTVDIPEVKPEVAKEEPVVQQAPSSVPQPKVEAKQVEPTLPSQSTPVEVKPAEPVAQEMPQTVAISVPAQETTEQKATEGQERRDNRGRGPRDNRGGRGERPRGEGYRRRENEEPRERRLYKPKGERRPEGDVREGEESQGSDEEPEVRNFRKEEIRKLEEEGFIVVGKPKPKPKNPKEQLSAHQKQHGKKYHHHNNPQNY